MSELAIRKALTATARALSGVDEELQRHGVGQGRVSNAKQLAAIREQLTLMETQLSSSQLPPKEQRVRGAGRAVADSWPFDSALGAMVLEAEQLYLKA